MLRRSRGIAHGDPEYADKPDTNVLPTTGRNTIRLATNLVAGGSILSLGLIFLALNSLFAPIWAIILQAAAMPAIVFGSILITVGLIRLSKEQSTNDK